MIIRLLLFTWVLLSICHKTVGTFHPLFESLLPFISVKILEKDGKHPWITLDRIINEFKGQFTIPIDTKRFCFKWGNEPQSCMTTSDNLTWNERRLALTAHFDHSSDIPFALSIFSLASHQEPVGPSITFLAEGKQPIHLWLMSVKPDIVEEVKSATKVSPNPNDQPSQQQSFLAKYWWAILGGVALLSILPFNEGPQGLSSTQRS